MPPTAGDRLGPYEIRDLLGKGGMGEVYRAWDTRLEREVALKVSNAQFSERFAREAKVVASLNHQNICSLYDVGPNYLVMELVEGATLADRISQGPIPLEESLAIARQMAGALEYAHTRAIVHRDFKPGNVKVRPDGTVKVLDFGLAKVPSRTGDSMGAGDHSPTLTMGMTEAGMILGTAAYMSPEQAKGKEVDKRTDIWAFGAVLYEMLTGTRLFKGETVSDILAAVIKDEPDWSRLPKPAERLVRSCLEKDADRRLWSARDMDLLLDQESTASSPSPQGPLYAFRRYGFAAPALVATLALAALAWIHFREQPAEVPVLRYTVPMPEKARTNSFAISPDGRNIAIAANGPSGLQLWVRPLDSLQLQALPGTEAAQYPFWSPDGRFIGFFARGKLKKIAVTGGPAETICDAADGRGGSWSQDGVIVFVPANGVGVHRVAAAGGVPVQLTKPALPSTHRYPAFLPDGRRFLYLASTGKDNGVYLASLDSKPDQANQRVLADDSSVKFVASTGGGYLLFVRERTLMAQPVDPESLTLRGDVFPLAEQVVIGAPNTNFGQFSVSSNGHLIYLAGSAAFERQQIWFDRTGKQLGAAGRTAFSRDFALSPDGKRLVIERAASGSATSSDLWIGDLERGAESRLTLHESVNRAPVWSPDGSRVAFSSDRNGGLQNIYYKLANGTGQDELLLRVGEGGATVTSWTPDGRFLIFSMRGNKAGIDIWALPVTGEKKPFQMVQGESNEIQGQVSPDGRWIAYTSDESRRDEVYVQPFSADDTKAGKVPPGKWQISVDGGHQPRWRADSKELFYVAGRTLMAVEIKSTAARFDSGTPQALFDLRYNPVTLGNTVFRYAPGADGKRFLVNAEPGESGEAPPLNVVTNWLGALKK